MDLRYPIGNFDYDAQHQFSDVASWVDDIRTLPSRISSAIQTYSQEELDTPYRPGGWTTTQVIHHLGDSHLNSLIRFKLALTEKNPTIKPYDEQAWTSLGDYDALSIEDGLTLLELIHKKWVAVLDQMNEEDFNKTFFHPESEIEYSLLQATAMYAWHGNHHLGHIQLIKRNQ